MAQDLKVTVLALNFSMPILASIAVLLRLYARKVSKADLGADDHLAVAALVCGLLLTSKRCSDFLEAFSICFAIDSIVGVYLGNFGGHIVLNPDGSLENFDQMVLFQKVFPFRDRGSACH